MNIMIIHFLIVLDPILALSVDYTHSTCHLPEVNGNTTCGISELDNLELDSPPDFQLADLPFGSQENIFSWLDRL